MLPDALKTRCSSCTKIQKAKALDAITRLYYQHPDKYLALAERYDPTGEYTRNFENWFDEQNAVKPPRNEGNQFITRATTKQPQRGVQANPNRIPTERTRIPSTWITTTNRPTTAQSLTSTRQTLRTLPSTVRSVETIFRELPTTLRFIPTTPPPTLRTTFRQPQTFRQTPTTTRFFSVPVTQPTIVRDPQFKDFPRSLETPAQPAINSFDEPQTPVFFQREPETVFRQPTTARPAIITQPPITRAQPPAVFRNIQTILRAPEASFVPRTEITQPPIITLPTTTSVTQPFVPRSSTAGQTQPPPVIARNPPPVFSLPENQPEQVFRDAPTTLRAPVQTQTILLTFRTQATTTTAARTQPPVIRENPPVFTAPDNERTQPRFGDSEPRTREIFTDSVENQPVSFVIFVSISPLTFSLPDSLSKAFNR